MLDDAAGLSPPSALAAIERETGDLGFAMASEARAGALLRVLAAAKPRGWFLELGTGTGLATAWLLDGMDRESRLITVEAEPRLAAVAERHLGGDPRLEIRIEDALDFLEAEREQRFDLIFADCFPGKFEGLERALRLLAPGGFYVVDDMLPQANWPAGHAPEVYALLNELEGCDGFARVELSWASGIVILVRTAEAIVP
ncbi:MAG: class I SAM-dependent methyltransferase [Rhodospirillales bacterium]|nr:class I SAM-dependent methyltransferase [Rhodospirillales bacterium]MDH3790265.1 class I SAM-dependent methyltransferase [Rhodospirillales bacterium]MDH3912485.1 class I SAM-dependent methyltransferase [Rhodospirillales bacterium]MDH3965719.1 class I SAM-dependent methyltransferase [Rhodospirillales bacterium]